MNYSPANASAIIEDSRCLVGGGGGVLKCVRGGVRGEKSRWDVRNLNTQGKR